jgi:hypothetical protein
LTVSFQVADAERAGSEAAWRGFLARFLLAITAGLISIAVLNFLVNPQGLYATHYFPQLLWGARPQKVAMLESVRPAPHALIMGSSRIMNLSPAELQRFTGLAAFNAGVDSAKAEDFYILLRYAVERAHLQPQLLIVGCDVEAFHNQEPVHYYLQQPSVLSSFLWRREARYWRWHVFTKLLSYEETELSIISLYKTLRSEKMTFSHVESDGRTSYDEWDKERAEGRLDQQREIAATIERFSPRYDQYTRLSEERLEYFDAMLQYAHQHHIAVVVFLTPMHPLVEAGLNPHGYEARKSEVTAALERMSAKWGAHFYDFSSPQSFGGDLSRFYDGVHYDDSLAPLIFARMLPVGAHAVQ